MTEQQKENIRLWVAELRSGKYDQGTTRLKKCINGQYYYCCFGVACEIKGLQSEPSQVEGVEQFLHEGNKFFILPPSAWFKKEFGFEIDQRVSNEENTLSYFNDFTYGFNRIADIIEEEFLKENSNG